LPPPRHALSIQPGAGNVRVLKKLGLRGSICIKAPTGWWVAAEPVAPTPTFIPDRLPNRCPRSAAGN